MAAFATVFGLPAHLAFVVALHASTSPGETPVSPEKAAFRISLEFLAMVGSHGLTGLDGTLPAFLAHASFGFHGSLVKPARTVLALSVMAGKGQQEGWSPTINAVKVGNALKVGASHAGSPHLESHT